MPGTSASRGWTVSSSWDSCSIRPHDGVGGRVPKPRNDSAASASTAIANDTDACTISRPEMFGSTCRDGDGQP